MLDWRKTFELLKGAVLQPERTWRAFRARRTGWRDTAFAVALPMAAVVAVLAPILAWLFGSNVLPGLGGLLAQMLLLFVGGLLALALSGAVFGLIAGSFGGRSSFDDGFAAVTLASVPGFAGQLVGAVPLIGWLAALGLSVYSLVLLYRNQPVFLGIPESRRIAHFVVSLVILGMVWILVSAPVAGLFMP